MGNSHIQSAFTDVDTVPRIIRAVSASSPAYFRLSRDASRRTRASSMKYKNISKAVWPKASANVSC